MKNLLSIVLLLFVVASCTQPTEPAGPSETDLRNEANVDLVYGWIEAARTGDMESYGAALADDYMSYGPGIADSLNKAQDIENWQGNWDNVFESIEYSRLGTATENPTEGPNAGDWVMDWAEITVNYKNGKTVNFRYNGVFRIEGGKIVVNASFFNELDILTQQGFTVNPPEDEGESS